MSFSEPLDRRDAAHVLCITITIVIQRANIPVRGTHSRVAQSEPFIVRNDALKRGHPGQLVGAEGIRGTWPLGRKMCRDIVPFLRAARRTGTFRNPMQISVISCNTVRCMLVGCSLV